MRNRYGTRRATSILLVVAVILGMVLPVPALAAGHTAPRAVAPRLMGSSIEGTITASDTGLGIPLAWVSVYTPGYELVAETQSDAAGKFTIPIDPGQYKLEFWDDLGDYQSQWYDGAEFFEEAELVTVDEVETVSGIDAALVPYGPGGYVIGEVSGKVRASNTGVGLAGVSVILEDPIDGYTVNQVETDIDGNYLLEEEVGDYVLKFVDGNGGYKSEYFDDSPLRSGATAITLAEATPRTADATLTYSPADILVSSAGWDDFGAILERLGWNYRVIDVEQFADPGFDPSPYKAFFANCSGETNIASDDAIAGIKSWVEAGGALYASDFAFSIVDKGFPGKVVFPEEPYAGDPGAVTADVKDAGLAWYMDPADPPATVDLDYDLGGWIVPASLGAGVTELLRGTPPGTAETRPLAASFAAGDGRVLYTTFHNEAQLSALQSKMLQYFALIPYTQDLVEGIEALRSLEYAGYDELASWLGAISEGQQSPAYTFQPGDGDTVVILDWTGATLKVTIKRPDGSIFAQQTSDGADPLEIPIPGGGASPSSIGVSAAGDWSIVIEGVDVANANTPFALKVFAEGEGGTPGAPVLLSVEGPTRVETAIKASQAAFTSADTVVLATAYNFPDALGGSSLAGALDAPLLLTAKDSLPAAVEAEIERLGATRAIILGSTAAVGAAVESRLPTVMGAGSTVKRIGGGDRYATAALIASETVGVIGQSAFDGKVFVATGENFPDALAASPLAAAKKRPILLTRATALPSSTSDVMTKLAVKSAVLIGSNKAVSDGVKASVGLKVGPANVSRLEGATRYQTAIELAKAGVAEGLEWDGVALATGTNYPDALSGGVMCAQLGTVMMLTDPGTLTPDVRTQLVNNKASIGTLRVLGSASAVGAGVRTAALNALK